MIDMMKKVGTVIFVGVLTLGSTSAIAWWSDNNDRWRDGPWYGGYPGYGGYGGYPGYGGWGGYPGYGGWGGYPGYGWGSNPGTTESAPPRVIE